MDMSNVWTGISRPKQEKIGYDPLLTSVQYIDQDTIFCKWASVKMTMTLK